MGADAVVFALEPVDYEYVRKGTANIFGAVEPKADRSGAEFAKMLAGAARCYPEADAIHLVMDNLDTHTEGSLTQFYGEEGGRSVWDRFTVHYTPKHGSWLNQVEIAPGSGQGARTGSRRPAATDRELESLRNATEVGHQLDLHQEEGTTPLRLQTRKQAVRALGRGT